MKKGCFIKIIIVLTILVAAGLYLIQNYGGKIKNMIVSKGKETVREYFINKYNTRFGYIKPSPERDSLELYMKKYFEKNFSDLDKINDESEEKIDSVLSSVEEIVNDSVVTKVEVNKIKKMIDEQ
jgi:hypothetical protein